LRRAHNQIRLRPHVDSEYPGSAAEEDVSVGRPMRFNASLS
jgi:hypothetical protein